MSSEGTERAVRPFSDRSLRLAARLLRTILREPNERERIDAAAAMCNAMFALARERPETYRRLTTHDWTGAALSEDRQ